MSAAIYHLFSYVLWIVALPWLWIRAKRRGMGLRWGERMGRTYRVRPPGQLIWFHAVSLGESQSLLLLIERIYRAHPHLHILITTSTPSAAELIAKRQKHAPYQNIIHQYLPYDHPRFVARFLEHWHPDLGLLVESELWPNLIDRAAMRGVKLVLLNARMSDRSFRRWQKPILASLLRFMLARFVLILAQDITSASRLKTFGAYHIEAPGNLKLNAPALPIDQAAYAMLADACKTRDIWLAASTHPGEEEVLAIVHENLIDRFPNLLSICIPRHIQRGGAIATMLRSRGLSVAQRSKGESITKATDIYLADSFGELGLFYRLSPLSFIGGSIIAHGGQNPLEAARLESVILHGSHIDNFAAIFDLLQANGASIAIEDSDDLTAKLAHLLTHPADAERFRAAASEVIGNLDDTCERTYELIHPLWDGAHV